VRAIESARRTTSADHGVALPRPWGWALLAIVLGGLAVADLVAIHTARSDPLVGVVTTTLGHDGVRLGSAALLGAGALWALRRSFFSLMASRPGGVELLPFTARDGGACPTDDVSAALRRELSALSLATPTPVPGESRPQTFVQAFRTATTDASTFYGALAGVLDWMQVSIGYEVSADLETRREEPGCGMTVRVRALPAGTGQRVTVWGTDWDDVARRGADVVGAYVVTRTRLCRRGPWSQWRGRQLRPELLRAYQQAQVCLRARRYEEALGHYYAALAMDPLNTPIRIEVCQVQEKLGLYLGALTGYVDVIVMESWKVDRRLWRRIVNDFYGRDSRPHHGDHRARWGGRRGSQESLMIARYRFVCALVNGDRVIDEWRQEEPAGSNDVRTREREGHRRRMSSWLSVYYARFREASDERDALPPSYGALMEQDRGERSPVFARLLRYVATVEADRLARDYAWFRGRRFPGMPLSETSLAVLGIWAPLHLMLVTDGTPPSTRAGDRLRRRLTSARWRRADLAELERELRRALRWTPSSHRGWQANYNVAAAFAVLLLRRPAEGTRRPSEVDTDDAAARAVRYLELAVTAISPAAVVDYEHWVAVGDQDLNGLRGTPQYVSFLERIFPAADRWQQRPYDLLTFLTSTHLVLLVREFAAQQVALVRAERAAGRTVPWSFDAEAVRLLHAYSADHADWRTRLRLIRAARACAARTGEAFDASFPEFAADPGLRSAPAGRSPADLRDPAEIDAYYERLTSLRHASWPALRDRMAELDDALEALNPRGVLSPSVPEPPPEHGAAVVEMWHTVLELCDSGLRNEQTRVPALRREVDERVAVRLGLLRRCAAEPGGSSGPVAVPWRTDGPGPGAGPYPGGANGSGTAPPAERDGRIARHIRALWHTRPGRSADRAGDP
jgi:hypothetical protein